VSTVQRAGTQPYSTVVVQGSAAGHASAGVHGTDGAQPRVPVCAHSKPYAHAGPVPQPGSGTGSALEGELMNNTAAAANAANTDAPLCPTANSAFMPIDYLFNESTSNGVASRSYSRAGR